MVQCGASKCSLAEDGDGISMHACRNQSCTNRVHHICSINLLCDENLPESTHMYCSKNCYVADMDVQKHEVQEIDAEKYTKHCQVKSTCAFGKKCFYVITKVPEQEHSEAITSKCDVHTCMKNIHPKCAELLNMANSIEKDEGHWCSKACQKKGMKSNKNYTKRWTQEEIFTLIDAWETNLKQYCTGVKVHFYAKVARCIERKRQDQVRNKVIDLKNKYKEVYKQFSQSGFGCDDRDEQSVQDAIKKKLFCFYELHEFLGCRANVKPLSLIDTCDENDIEISTDIQHIQKVIPQMKTQGEDSLLQETPMFESTCDTDACAEKMNNSITHALEDGKSSVCMETLEEIESNNNDIFQTPAKTIKTKEDTPDTCNTGLSKTPSSGKTEESFSSSVKTSTSSGSGSRPTKARRLDDVSKVMMELGQQHLEILHMQLQQNQQQFHEKLKMDQETIRIQQMKLQLAQAQLEAKLQKLQNKS